MSNKTHTQKTRFEKSDTGPSNDVYARVTQKIIADLEQGNLTWRKPWDSLKLDGFVQRPLRWNDIPYSGINTIMLWAVAAEQGFHYPHWMTFNQAIDLKANIRKGEKGTQVVYADHIVKQDEDKNGETITTQIPFLKGYIVFNVAQIDNLPEKYYQHEPVLETSIERDQRLDQFFQSTHADIRVGTNAAYSIDHDRIMMPPFETFETVPSYYATLAHEMCHWTRHPKRLDRDFGRKRFGDEGYAKEELVAELGACFLACDLGIEPTPEVEHAAYIQSWLRALNDDKKLIFSAASHAQKAVEYILALQPA
ncbi:ArdC family protein [Dyadobacter jiangsuensis]